MRTIILSIMVLLAACLGATATHAMQDDINQALTILQRFQRIPEQTIPPAIMKEARGLAFVTMTKAGFIFSGRGGKGIVIARTERGWSGPSGIGTGGIGFGFQAGAHISEFVIVLNTDQAVDAFSKGGNVTLGSALGIALGPLGRTAEANVAIQAVTYTYSRSQGIFAGISLEGTVIGTRAEANGEYYGKPVDAKEILAGKVRPPAGARKLLRELSRY